MPRATRSASVAALSMALLVPNLPATTIRPATSATALATAKARELILGALLNSLADRLDVSIEKAGSVANGVVIRAGGETWSAINNFRVAYKDLLNESVDKLDAAATKQLQQIQSAVGALERQSAADMKEIERIATQGLLVVPLSNKQPQVLDFSPAYEVYMPRATDSIRVTVNGIFFYAKDPGMEPYIRIGTTRLAPIHKGTQDLMFMIPRSSIAAPSGRQVAYVKLPLVVPYKIRQDWTHLWAEKSEQGDFALAMIGLPPSPGRIFITSRNKMTVPDHRHVSTVQFNIQSDRDDHELDVCGPDEGAWTIDPSTVRIVIDRQEGSTSTNRPVRVNNPSVCWHWRTEHHGLGTSDKVWFHFEYDVTSSHDLVNSDTATVDLRWGDSKVFPLPNNGYTIDFDAFDGSRQQFTGPELNNRYIEIKAEGSGVKIAARPVTAIPSR